jgi:chorismate mutase/prephenate dehydrogenase
MAKDIDSLRHQIDEIDRSILELIKKRTDIASDIGRLKAGSTLPVRNFDREKVCIDNARKIATELGLPLQLAEEIQLKLIRVSLTSQEQDRVRQVSTENAKKAAVIGGAGKMGNWFAHFLASQGFKVEIFDPNASLSSFPTLGSLGEMANHDVIVVATPLHESNRILMELSQLEPSGLVFDVASLKGPLKEGLSAVSQVHMKVTSMHPMFGPDTKLLSGRHVIIVDLGNEAANAEAAALFAPTMATIIHMGPEDHDRNMAFLLGLSHAVNIVFSSVLAQSGESAPRLEELSSTTFDAQISIASRVAMENPKLYFEIQAANPYGDLPLQMLEKATQELREIVTSRDEGRFVELMQAGYKYYQTKEKGRSL